MLRVNALQVNWITPQYIELSFLKHCYVLCVCMGWNKLRYVTFQAHIYTMNVSVVLRGEYKRKPPSKVNLKYTLQKITNISWNQNMNRSDTNRRSAWTAIPYSTAEYFVNLQFNFILLNYKFCACAPVYRCVFICVQFVCI